MLWAEAIGISCRPQVVRILCICILTLIQRRERLVCTCDCFLLVLGLPCRGFMIFTYLGSNRTL